jgi:citrate synthase
MDAFLTAAEAAAYLGVKRGTLYAYVSRGLLDSAVDPADPRRRRYRRDDLERLKRRSDAHAGEAAAAATALDWGAPSLDTAITRITPAGPAYRGHAAVDLARAGVAFEAVAELLWTGLLPASPPRWAEPGPSPLDLRGVVADDAWSIDVLRVATSLAGLRDPERFGGAPETELRVARHLVVRVVRTLAAHRRAVTVGGPSVAGTLMAAFGATPTPVASRVVDAALVTLADHELNASAFAARVAASTGADLYACVDGALAAFTGARHGGACDRCAALVAEVEAADAAVAVLTRRMRRGEALPGFGHRLYPDGDPRFATLSGVAAELGALDRTEVLREIAAVAGEMGLGAPTTDLGALFVTRAVGLPDEAAGTLFAVGRMAGWIAHAYEQRHQGHLLRPRARYVGA